MTAKCSFILLLAVLLVACARPASSAALSYSDGVLTLNGDIDDRLVEALQRMGHEPIRTLVVTSSGGQTSDAIRMVNTLGVGRYDVVVRDYCLSACASILFAAAKNRAVEDGAVVVFHGTDLAKMQLARAAINPDDLAWSPVEQADSQREAEIYHERGINPVFFKLAELRREPMCFTQVNTSGPQPLASWVMRRTAYMPTLATMRRFGMPVAGREMSDAERLHKASDLEAKLHARFSIVLDHATEVPADAQIDRQFAALRLPECDKATRRQLSGDRL